MEFEDKYFAPFAFNEDQIERNLNNAFRDIDIARRDTILEVKFNYTYTAFLKLGIALISFYQRRIRSAPGHHAKVIEKMAEILQDEMVFDIGNVMRSKRNKDMYAGGVEITEKECKGFLAFVEGIAARVKNAIQDKNTER